MTAEQTAPNGPAAMAMLPARPPQPAGPREPAGSRDAADGNLRERLSEFRALLVISLLMTEAVGEDQILELAASSAPGLGPWRIEGYGFADGSWHRGTDRAAPVPADLAGQLAALDGGSGRMELPGRCWAWAFPLRSVSGPLGHLVASCDREPSAEERFLIQVIAQQTGVAVSNARLHAKERATAAELAATNAALAETVTSLRRSMDIHDRLTRVAVSGEGQPVPGEVLPGQRPAARAAGACGRRPAAGRPAGRPGRRGQADRRTGHRAARRVQHRPAGRA